MKKNFCRWYDETSAMKRAYDKGLIDEKWVKNYCCVIIVVLISTFAPSCSRAVFTLDIS